MRDIARLRMFAGPNGSGKSTLKSILPKALLGIYVNPDEVEEQLRNGSLDFHSFDLSPSAEEVREFFRHSTLGTGIPLGDFRIEDGRAICGNEANGGYLAAAIVEFIVHKLIERGKEDRNFTFTLETVMSHRSKVEVLRKARHIGFRTYLYYVATDDFSINVLRIHARVALGGHSVPDSKVESRYFRSLSLLIDAIKQTDRAYIFDNSADGLLSPTWIAEITDGRALEIRSDVLPSWFQHFVMEKIT